MSRPPATTAGFVVSTKGRRVYLVDAEHGRDPGMSHHEAKELAQRLLHTAAVAERHLREDSNPFACPGCGERDPEQQHALVGSGAGFDCYGNSQDELDQWMHEQQRRSSRK
jgi:hypothetical protein